MTWKCKMILVIVTLFYTGLGCYGYNWDEIKLYPEHIPFFFNNNPEIKNLCSVNETCPYKVALSMTKCWGYEKNCNVSNRMKTPLCDVEGQDGTVNLTSQLDMFWKQADFGYVNERLNEMKTLCTPNIQNDSSLDCVKYAQFCRGKNIYFDFRGANISQSKLRYREDIFKAGQIGGHCTLNKEALVAEKYENGLESWYPELEQFSTLKFIPNQRPQCEIVFHKPTYFVKLSSGISMYHRFCDIINLYIAQHLNNSFSTDVNIIMWDTSYLVFKDLFQSTWDTFTDHPVRPLRYYDAKRVCIKEVVFTFLPRMENGIYCKMPTVPGCQGSSMVHAFSQHLMHRLNISQEGPTKHSIRITLLSVNTRFKNILNRNEIIARLKTIKDAELKFVEYNVTMPFLEQIKISHNSDIFIGMNGEGLTHLLFQPDWAVIFEIHNCGDQFTYFNLSRLRGIKYMTWEKKEKMVQEDINRQPTTTNPELSNYSFDEFEFMRLIFKAAHYIRTNPNFIAAWKQKYGRRRMPAK
ncbi:hypothetical protein CHS0354_023483 [Potamilus streckersoni]|uniref:EGF domain-specific O-linked N-acetylglucosamine transferase n=1 Tax=Potamilus streckersoni TaxID=2493646 RepID=A0AAE0VNM8_9BIVA|nr:hypothetical protein CHS0354_023483 [Potamilus streckersoni]